MPFTPSHAVVALPFIRTPLVPAAIAIGAMTPDLPLFLRVGLRYSVLHDPRWIPLTALLALALLVLWRLVIRPAVSSLVWGRIARRTPSGWDAPAADALRELFVGARGAWRTSGLLAVSLLLGVATHIVWDSFTHEGRAGVDLIPVLDGEILGLPAYKWLQHGTGALALLILAVFGTRWLRRAAVRDIDPVFGPLVRWIWVLSLPGIMLLAWVQGVAVWGWPGTTYSLEELAYLTLPPACAVWGIVTVALCLLVAWFRFRDRRLGELVAAQRD